MADRFQYRRDTAARWAQFNPVLLEGEGSLRLVEFDWKKNGKHSYGFIADEVEEVYPDMVMEDDNGYKTLDYNAAICTKLAELERIIRAKNNRLKELEKLIVK